MPYLIQCIEISEDCENKSGKFKYNIDNMIYENINQGLIENIYLKVNYIINNYIFEFIFNEDRYNFEKDEDDYIKQNYKSKYTIEELEILTNDSNDIHEIASFDTSKDAIFQKYCCIKLYIQKIDY
jgi:hypothetical protein